MADTNNDNTGTDYNTDYNNIIIEYTVPNTEVNEFDNLLVDKIVDNIKDNVSFKNTNISILPIPIINENAIDNSIDNEIDNEIEEIKNLVIYKTCYSCNQSSRPFTILYDGSYREICVDCYSERLQEEYEADENEKYWSGIKLDRQLRLTECNIMW